MLYHLGDYADPEIKFNQNWSGRVCRVWSNAPMAEGPVLARSGHSTRLLGLLSGGEQRRPKRTAQWVLLTIPRSNHGINRRSGDDVKAHPRRGEASKAGPGHRGHRRAVAGFRSLTAAPIEHEREMTSHGARAGLLIEPLEHINVVPMRAHALLADAVSRYSYPTSPAVDPEPAGDPTTLNRIAVADRGYVCDAA